MNFSWLGWVKHSMVGKVPSLSWNSGWWGLLCKSLLRDVFYTGCVLHSHIWILEQMLLPQSEPVFGKASFILETRWVVLPWQHDCVMAILQNGSFLHDFQGTFVVL